MLKVQNILRITNDKEEQIEKRTEKYCRKERTYTWTNIADFAWSLMKQALEILRDDSKHPFSLFLLLQFLKNLTGDRSLPDWENEWILQQERELIFSLKFAGIIKKKNEVLICYSFLSMKIFPIPSQRKYSQGWGCAWKSKYFLFSVKIIHCSAKFYLQVTLAQIRAIPLT